jgi:hypothetical protein
MISTPHKPHEPLGKKKKSLRPKGEKQKTGALKNELILRLGLVPGKIELLGTRVSHGWRFRTLVVDQGAMMLTDEDRGDLPLESRHKSEWVDTWRAALALLDKYRWHRLYPVFAHPDFQQRVWTAVQKRFERDKSKRLSRPFSYYAWRERCGRSPQSQR